MKSYSKNPGKPEIVTQKRVIDLFENQLGYTNWGSFEQKPQRVPWVRSILKKFLREVQGYSEELVDKAINKFEKTAINLSEGLYQANKAVYQLLRYGVNVKQTGKQSRTLYLIDWEKPEKNRFYIAEEVAVEGENDKRPDIVLYVNGIALAVLELKRAVVDVAEGIRQNLDNQSDYFIPQFFTTMQWVLAGNDTQGLRYGTVETPEKFYVEWKHSLETPKTLAGLPPLTQKFDYNLDYHLYLLFNKKRFIETIYNFVVFDKGQKKICRPNQYFAVKAAQDRIIKREGGVIWQTQGSGKSMIMVWLAKWIRENIDDSRVLIITDREELDAQIEGLFVGVGETTIYRTSSGSDLIGVLGKNEKRLMASLVHKFGKKSGEADYDKYIEELKASLPSNFVAQGDIYVFVDECHRTQSGKLHEAMRAILPEAMFIGFTGTPLLKADKAKTIEVFGNYIGTPYKYDQAIADGVVLGLLYEARDVDQWVSNPKKVDQWFETKTAGLNDRAKARLKKEWGTMKKVRSSEPRLIHIVKDIISDFGLRKNLVNNKGNALLVAGDIEQACRYYDLFQSRGFRKCAIITSYRPHISDIKGESTGENEQTKAYLQYEVYRRMLNGEAPEAFETRVKKMFKEAPAKMQLLIVVDKLLTGFDAPAATYLYIDKSMRDHGLFQAICRVNRVNGKNKEKEYGYIIDYKDLFKNLSKSMQDYTSEAFDQYDADDVKGLLKDRYEEARARLDVALDMCESTIEVVRKKDDDGYRTFFCGNTEKPHDLKAREPYRDALYKHVGKLVGAYANIANEMGRAGYSAKEAQRIKQRVNDFKKLRDYVGLCSGDFIDLKRAQADMRQLMDLYLDASASKTVSDFEDISLVELIVKLGESLEEENKHLRGAQKKAKQQEVAEVIENNIRKAIIEQEAQNPVYYAKMSDILLDLVAQRKDEAEAYAEHLAKMKALAEQVHNPSGAGGYPSGISGKKVLRALYEHLDKDETLVLALDQAIMNSAQDDWQGHPIKRMQVRNAVLELVKDETRTDEVMGLIMRVEGY